MWMAEHLKIDASDTGFSGIGRDKLDEIWKRCIEKCHSKTRRQLLCSHGKLVSILEAEGVLIADIAFWDEDIKSRADRFLSSITHSLEIVVKHNVEVRIGLLPNNISFLKADNNGVESCDGKLEGPIIETKKNTDSSCDVSMALRRSFENIGNIHISAEAPQEFQA
ncbi:hypothetical protein H6P81_013310 [Aristolochia fimbriata]|uniref:STICHEL DnaA-N-like alpha-beta domain-containing protein n=1 Tax=Aristolochia fimbriata TaxID=158543 RepID=A0AAV7EHM0_ARIFI|nr:hypothetical protein H6P81_013310 [Aristolochia fimbriata]